MSSVIENITLTMESIVKCEIEIKEEPWDDSIVSSDLHAGLSMGYPDSCEWQSVELLLPPSFKEEKTEKKVLKRRVKENATMTVLVRGARRRKSKTCTVPGCCVPLETPVIRVKRQLQPVKRKKQSHILKIKDKVCSLSGEKVCTLPEEKLCTLPEDQLCSLSDKIGLPKDSVSAEVKEELVDSCIVSPISHSLSAYSGTSQKHSKVKRFKYKSSHQQQHKTIYQHSQICCFCGKIVSSLAHLVAHERIHTGEKPYQCPVCQKWFTMQGTMVKHQRRHFGEKPYLCSVCGKRFTRSDSVKHHMRIHTGERPFKCDICEMSFNRPHILVNHKRLHSGERPYSCKECGKCFAHSGTLFAHKRMHKGEKKFGCDLCGKRFAMRGSLNIHKQKHAEMDAYDCNDCGKYFFDKKTLIDHVVQHMRKKTVP